jgi:hypothetical protein
MESEFAKIIYARINGIPWQPQIAKFLSRQKTGYTVFDIVSAELQCKLEMVRYVLRCFAVVIWNFDKPTERSLYVLLT